MRISTTIRPLNYDDIFKGLLDYLDLVKMTEFNRINFNFKFLDKINEDFMEWDEYARNLKTYCDNLNIDIVVTHAYYLNSFLLNVNSEINENQSKKIEKCIELTKMIGANIMVVHAGIFIDGYGNYNDEKTIEENVKYFLPLCKKAKEEGIKLAIENNVVCNETKIGEIVEPSVIVLNKVCENINEIIGEKIIGLCYDTGHANLANKYILNDMKIIKDNIITLHLHNNDGYDSKKDVWECDKHSSLLNGVIDYKKIIIYLKNIDFDGEIVIESYYRGNNEEIINLINEDILFCKEE